ncbi:MAG: hypothetical protein QG650_36 [Patescibacteria group bacterium]|nr:hypothetical protein [Patescibacteria group bacterium]
MKIISLNCWGARINPEILDFLIAHRDSVDAFCFQEMMRDTGDDEFDPLFDPKEIRNTVETFSELLPGFEHRFATFYGNDYGIATFVRESVGIADSFERFVHLDDTRIRLAVGNEGAHSRKVLVTTLGNGIHLANLHGLWIGGYGKGDHPDRIAQSEKILAAVLPLEGPKILMGDFNLNPDTRSYRMFSDAGFSCLVERFGITSTRTPLYEKPGKYADYALVTPDVPVRDFRVLPDVVSDHAPLLLEIAA